VRNGLRDASCGLRVLDSDGATPYGFDPHTQGSEVQRFGATPYGFDPTRRVQRFKRQKPEKRGQTTENEFHASAFAICFLISDL